MAAQPTLRWTYPQNNGTVTSVTPIVAAYGTSAVPAPQDWVFYWFVVCPSVNGQPADYAQCAKSPTLSTYGVSPVGTWQVPAGTLKWGDDAFWYVQVSDTQTGSTISNWQKFTVLIPQPRINAELTKSSHGREFNALTGNYTSSVTDASVTSVGPPLSVTRTYNSADPRVGIFGAGWSSRWDTKLVTEPSTGTILLTRPDGSQVRFGDKGGGTYASPAGLFYTLATVSGGGWRLMDKSAMSYLFDASGRLTKLTDARGRAQELLYGSDGNLAKVTAPGGRALTFTWDGTHVATVATDPVNGQPLTWTYTYSGDKLIKVCGPGSSQACTVYAYGDGSAYRSAVLNAVPLHYWRLGEPSNAGPLAFAVDEGLAESYEAQYARCCMTGAPGALAGSTDTAMSLSAGNTGYLSLPDNTLNLLGGQLSVEAWFKTSGSGTILGSQDTRLDWNIYANFGPVLYVGKDGKLRGKFTSSGTPITSSGVVNNGAWHHVALSSTGSSQTLYLDGVPVGTKTGAVNESLAEYAQLGTGQTSSGWPSTTTSNALFPFVGQIDEFAVYNKPLNAAQVQEHYAARLATPQLTTLTLPSGRTWANNTYETVKGRLKTHTDDNGGLWQIGLPTPDPNTEQDTVTVTDPHGGTIKTAYDFARQRAESLTDQLGKTTSYEYDTGGFVAKITDPNGKTTQLTHDQRGNELSLKKCRSAGNCQTTYATYYLNSADMFDPRNDQMTVYRDARSAGPASNTYATAWEYTAFGEKAKETAPITTDFPNGRSTTYAYTDGTEAAVGGGTTPAGLVKSETDPKSNQRLYAYSSAGDLAQITEPTGLITKFGYDAIGRTVTRTQVSGTQSPVTTSYSYDPFGRTAKVTGFGVKNEISGVTHTAESRYTYDDDGNKLTETLADLTGGDVVRTTTLAYDTYGRLEKVTGPEGGIQQTAYDHMGKVVTTTDAAGATYTYGYTSRGEPASVTLKGWTGSPTAPEPARDVVTRSYAYDPGGRLASETDVMGRTTRYTYFDDNSLAETIADRVKLNASGTPVDVVLTSSTYDAAGNLTRQVAGGGKTQVDYVYDASGRLTSSTLDPAGLGRRSSYVYDANTNVTQTSWTATGSTRTEIESYRYDAGDRLIEQTVENGATDLTTSWTVDDRGLVTEITDPRGNAAGATRSDYTSLIGYDALGRTIKVEGAPVKVERNGAAATTERPTSLLGYNTAGEQTHETAPEGRTSLTAYDKAGRVTSVTGTAYTPPGGTALTPRTSYGYDAAGRVTSVTDPRGNVSNATYDVLGRTVRITDPPATQGAIRGNWDYTYTLNGERLSSTDPTGARIEATYDGLGRQVTLTQIERKPTAVALTTVGEYDNAGNLVAVKRPAGNRSTATINAAGEVETETDPLAHSTKFEYDGVGRPAKVTDALGNATVAEYDLAGRKIVAKDLNPSGTLLRTYGFEYDDASNLTAQTSPEGHVTRRSYDAADQLTKLVEPVSATKTITTAFGYDAAGQRTRTTDGRGNAFLATYNSLGMVEARIEPATQAHPDLADRTWTMSYDAVGNQVGVLQPGGVRITNAYDNLNRLVTEAGSGAESATQTNTFGYDLAGRRTSAGDLDFTFNDRGLLLKTAKTGSSSDLSSFGYDANDRLTQRTDASGAATFTWDNADRLKTFSDPVTATTLTYGYDNADRLTGIDYGTSGPKRTYSYDPMDRLTGDMLKTSAGAAIASITYGYDRDDNLTTKTTTGTAGAGINAYTYDHSNRLTSWTAPGGAVTDYSWDDSGNRTQAGSKTFTYDERNRLLSGDGTTYTYTARGTTASETKGNVTKVLQFDALDRMTSDGEAVYTYDALDRVISRTQGGAVSRYVYGDQANDIVAMTDGAGAVQARYSRGLDGEPIGISDGSGARFAFADQHGDVVGTFGATATSLADSVAYNPFGEETARTGARHDLGYQGELTDPTTGKVNMHARWYQPGTGTFSSRDTWTLNPDPSIQINRYTYGNGNPVSNIDPSGHGRPYPPCRAVPWTPARVFCDVTMNADPLADPKDDQCSSKLDTRCNPVPDDTCSAHKPQCRTAPQTPLPDMGPLGHVKSPNAPNKTYHPSNPGPPRPPVIDCSHGPTEGHCDKLPPSAKKGCPGCFINGYNPDLDVLNCDLASPDSRCPAERPDLVSCMGTCAPPSNCGTAGSGGFFGAVYTACPPPGQSSPPTIQDLAQQCTDNILCDILIGDGVNCIANPNWVDCISAGVGLIPVGRLLGTGIKLGSKLPKILKPVEKCLTHNSFVAGTMVLMADGTHKPIEEVQVGDFVQATDPETGKTGPRIVLDLITGDGAKSLVEITADTDGQRGDATGVVIATDGHPFWAPELHKWLTAAELRVGTLLQTSAGTHVQITAIKKWTGTQQVNNLTVAGFHTYHVVAGEQAILVHNSPPCEIIIDGKKYPESAKHIEDAQNAGHPDTLTIDRTGAKQNRRDSLRGHPTVSGKQRDEYPPAMFKEGGSGASVRPINGSDNGGAGASIGNQARKYSDGTQVQIKVEW
ncbi:LamG-like jellyroll fold domain-containing protein [Sphaerisporangium sp. NPDC049002]|uniref:LamG-like jellyroll fold domain-containing protein n=1 Tax=Sphaerisporangium sp. NPDC049002 TaxID=3155392 RepID=UPI0033C91C1F